MAVKPTTNQLYNTQTLKPEILPESEIARAIASGSHAYKKGTKVNVLDENNQSFSLDATELPQALNTGYKIEPVLQQVKREAKQEAEKEGLPASLKRAGEEFVNQLAFGVPDIIQDKTSDDYERARQQGLNEANKLASVVGGTAGFLTSIPLGGPLFKAGGVLGKAAGEAVARGLAKAGVEKTSESLASRILANTAEKTTRLGVEGATIAAPVAITEAALGDPEAAAESLLLSGGIGIGLGGLGSLFGAGKRVLGEVISTDKVKKFIDEMADDSAIRSIGFKKSDITRLASQGSDISENRLKEIATDLRDSGLVKAGDTLESIGEKVALAKDTAITKNADYLNRLDDTLMSNTELRSQAFDPRIVAERIKKELIEPIESFGSRSGELKAAQEYYEDIVNNLGVNRLGFNDAIKFKNTMFGDLSAVYKRFPPTEKDEITKRAYRIYTDAVEDAAQNAFSVLGNKNEVADYIKNKKLLRNLNDLDNAVTAKQAGELANRRIGLTDFITGATGYATLGPVGLLALVGKKLSEKYGNAIGTEYLGKLSNALKADPRFANAGVIQAEKANKIVGDQIETALDLFNPTKTTTKAQVSTSAIDRFLGEEHKDLSLEDKISKLNEKVSELESNAVPTANQVSMLASNYNQFGAPAIGTAYQVKTYNALKYLNSIVPKPITPPNPFHKVKFKPSDSQMASLNRKLEVLHNPFSVLPKLKNGSLTRDEVQVLKMVYPKIHQSITRKLTEHAMKPNVKPLSYQQRIKLSLLFETNLDPSLTPGFVQGMQNSFAQQPQQQSPQGSVPLTRASKLNLASQSQTQAEKLLS